MAEEHRFFLTPDGTVEYLIDGEFQRSIPVTIGEWFLLTNWIGEDQDG